jgi:ribonuclease P protein component
MLPKSKKLNKDDFKNNKLKVFFRGDICDVAFLQVYTSEVSKYACVISKKTINKAVNRNLIKRRFFSIINGENRTSSLSFVIYPKKQSLTAPYSHLKKEIEQAFATLH